MKIKKSSLWLGCAKDKFKYTLVYLSIQVIRMDATTIKLHQNTKAELDKFREYKNESYEEVIQKVLFIAKKAAKEPELSKEALESIEKARERIKKGNFVTETEAKKRLGL